MIHVGDIMMHVGDIRSIVGCSVLWGVIMSTVGDIMMHVGDIMSTVGYDSFEVEEFESHSFNKPFHDRNSCRYPYIRTFEAEIFCYTPSKQEPSPV